MYKDGSVVGEGFRKKSLGIIKVDDYGFSLDG